MGRIALIEPDRPHNLGLVLRLGACLGFGVDVVEPCGFPLDDRRIRQAGLDYADQVELRRHADLEAFMAWAAGQRRRLLLLSTRAELPYHQASFRETDILILGSESKGAPETVHARADLSLRIPMRPGLRSLNLALAGAIVAGEFLRQTAGSREPRP